MKFPFATFFGRNIQKTGACTVVLIMKCLAESLIGKGLAFEDL